MDKDNALDDFKDRVHDKEVADAGEIKSNEKEIDADQKKINKLEYEIEYLKDKKNRDDSYDEKYYYRLLFLGFILYVMSIFPFFSEGFPRVIFVIVNIFMLLYALGYLGIYSVVVTILTMIHTEIIGMIFGLLNYIPNEYTFQIYYPWWILFILYRKYSNNKTQFWTSVITIYAIIFLLIGQGLLINIIDFGQNPNTQFIKDQQLEQVDDFWLKTKCLFGSVWKQEDFGKCVNPLNETTTTGEKRADLKSFTFNIKKKDRNIKQITNPLIDEIPAKIEFESKNQNLTLELRCIFKRNGQANVEGKITGEKTLHIGGTQDKSINVGCIATEDLVNGIWKIEFVADVKDIKTFSELPRLFVNKSSSEEEIKRLTTTYIDKKYKFKKNRYETLVPGTDLAYLSFNVGDLDNPVIQVESTKPTEIFLSVDVINNNLGKIKNVEKISFKLGEGFVKDEDGCPLFEQEDNYLRSTQFTNNFKGTKKGDSALYRSCKINLDHEAYKNPKNRFINTNFEGEIQYSYEFKRVIEVLVNKKEETK